MTTILKKMNDKVKAARKAGSSTPQYPTIIRTTEYTSLPVDIPDSFLAPLLDPSTIKVSRLNFLDSPLPEYRHLFAVVLDNVLSQQECDQLLHMGEMSAGAHRQGEPELENNGWKPAMVNVGRNREVMALDYRNSDRIIWDEKTVTERLWARVMQGEGMKEYFSVLKGRAYVPVAGDALAFGNSWVVTDQGLNERMRFLKYCPGQFFREHCDGTYETPDGLQRSFYTYHLYLNDSAQALGMPEPAVVDLDEPAADASKGVLRGGATSFYSRDLQRRFDVDPKAGRVLIFQHRGLLHSGDDVTAGIKYTIRSDLMFEQETMSDKEENDNVVFEE